MLKIYFLFSFLFLVVYSKEVCYDQLGCFTDSYPFSGSLQRPIGWLPESPQKVAVKFLLYNRKLGNSYEIINTYITGDDFDPSLSTKFIVHGFLHNSNKKWIADLKNAILKAENVNVIVVDWSKGAGFPYTQATANTQVVGAEIARLISVLVKDKGVKSSSFHLIGHSLGSHIAGYAGKRIPGIGRITGLDPAGPYFENTDPVVRLDSSDARYVDVIHSDGTANLLLGFGLMQPIGHADFYPNGGKDQPDCPANSDKVVSALFNIVILDYDGMEESLGCSHLAAVYFFIDSITNLKCGYAAHSCDSKSDFDSGNCLKCSEKGCNQMGYWSSPNKDNGKLYLNTQSLSKDSLYCQQNYMARLVSNSKQATGLVQARGKFTIYFETSTETSTIEMLDDSEATFKPDSVEIRLVSLNEPLLSQVNNLYISYTKTSSFISGWLYDSEWSFKYVEILKGDSQVLSKYCPTTVNIQSTKTVKFIKC